MKIEPPVNQNYAATVVRVKTLVPLPNADRLAGMPMFGLQAIVSLDIKEGDLGLLFPAECQLSEEYTRLNNLHRHSDLNEDKSISGYLEDNRRVRAIKLRGNRSDALFMPISSLAYLGDIDLKEGDTFDRIGDHEICRKYTVPTKGTGRHIAPKKLENRVDGRVFPEHFDTPQYLRLTLDPDAYAVVTQKLHGTSIRIGNVPVRRSLPLRDRIAKRFGVKVLESEYANVYGSHRVVKDANNPNQNHYYDHDLWTACGKELDGLIPENYIVYGELIGWTDGGSPIQKGYTYNLLPKQRRLYVYRVAVVNEQGTVADLSWDAVRKFCQSIGVEHVPELWRGHLRDFAYEQWIDVKFMQSQAVPVGDAPCDEGVCIRIDDGMIPTIAKLKSPLFLQHETKMIDQGAEDLEAAA